MIKGKGFLLHTSYYDVLQDFTLEQKGELFDAMFLYNRGETVKVSQGVQIGWRYLRAMIDANNEGYEAAKKKKEEALARWRERKKLEREQRETEGDKN